jgi:hypothetical protein
MTNSLGCEICGSELSYGEQFRHRLALDAAGGRHATQAILGDRAFPRQPRPICAPCRLPIEAALRDRRQSTRPASDLTKILAGIATVVLIGLVTG